MKILLLALVLFLCASPTAANLTVEIDLDGVVGNGPDLVAAQVSDPVASDVWILGDPLNLIEFTLIVCNLDGSLEFQSANLILPAGWDFVPVAVDSSGCVTLHAFSVPELAQGVPLVPPAKVGTVTWHAAVDHSCDDLTVDLVNSEYFEVGVGGAGAFISFVGAVVDIGGGCSAPTARDSWGALKALFR